jgi:CHAT domain-containing protein
MLEATALLNIGRIASHQERHDEALRYYQMADEKANELGANDLEQRAVGNSGWEHYVLGNSDKALKDFDAASGQAALLGDMGYQIRWLTTSALVYADSGELALAEQSDLHAIELARQIRDEQQVVNASEDLSQVYVNEGRPNDADRYAAEALALAQRAGNRPDILYCHMLQGEAAALRHDFPRADALLHEVILAPESQNRMRWNSQHTLARMYEEQGQPAAAEQAYKAAIALVEGARRDLHQELSRLTFLTNAARIYDDYIHFLVAQGRVVEALDAADWSRARTLQQGLGVIPASADAAMKPSPLRAVEIARRTRSTLLFYWMGERQSYLWAVSPEMTTLLPLPPKAELVAKMRRYRRTILALKDPLRENSGQGDTDARELYQTLLAPVRPMLGANRPVVLFTDGEMTQLNFETLVAPPADGGSLMPHFWIEDATITSSPSIRLFAAKNNSASPPRERLLLLGDAPSPDVSLPTLPMAGLEVRKVSERFRVSDEEVFAGTKATPLAYIAAHPERFAYIHFVAHATASGTDPLESAVILSRDSEAANNQGAGDGTYKLYASEILQHPIAARLVTISACNSSGTATYAGEGVVGLSWAFLRAGAHNTIAALWDVSDASTPEVMDRLYAGLGEHQPPAEALRKAKLSLLREGGEFARPFYWAPFQLYSGR